MTLCYNQIQITSINENTKVQETFFSSTYCNLNGLPPYTTMYHVVPMTCMQKVNIYG